MKHGMTLTSLLVAVALSGIIAVFGGRLIINQMFMAATAELIDQGDTVMSFYVNALRDREVWRCTLFDTANEDFRKLVLGGIGTTAQVSLRDPRCKSLVGSSAIAPTRFGLHEWRNHPILSSNTDRGKELLPKAGKYVGDSISGDDVGASDGWWKINLEAKQAGGKGDVDMILKLCLQESVYTTKNKGYRHVPRGYRYKCPSTSPPSSGQNMTRHIRYSENVIKDSCSSGKAIISVTDRTGPGIISTGCSSFNLLSIRSASPYELDPLGQRTDRQGIKPESPDDKHPVIGTDDTGSLIIGTDRALVGRLPMICPTERGGIEQVLCGFTDAGSARCCTPRGPKGPKGLKGCRPVIRRNVHDNSRICISTPDNTGHCPHENDSDSIIDVAC